MFQKHTNLTIRALVVMLLVAPALLDGCSARTAIQAQTSGPGGITATLTTHPGQPAVTLTPSPLPTPTSTPEPLALRVNGDGISVAEYNAELGQLQDALKTLGKTQTPQQERQQVLDDLTDTLLLAQGALENGYKIDDAGIQAEIDKMAQQLGGAQAVQDWATQRGYSDADFRAALKRQLAAAWQRDKIAATVPEAAEQVHARQILTTDEAVANRALELLKVPGTNFAQYAYQYDPETGGDLGWFPRGYLTQPEVEAAAFQLQPGQISPVIKSAIGYHIIQVVGREPSRPLSPDARRVLQHKALEDWLKARRQASKVEILLP